MIQTLITNGLTDLLDAGLAILVPVAIQYLLTKVSKTNLEKNTKLALNVVRSVQVAADINVDVTKVASQKLETLTKGKLKSDVIEHLIGSAMYEINKDVVAALATDNTTPVVAPVAPVAPVTTPVETEVFK